MIDYFMNKVVILLFLTLMTVEVGGQELKKVWPNDVGSEERAFIESIGVETASTRGQCFKHKTGLFGYDRRWL